MDGDNYPNKEHSKYGKKWISYKNSYEIIEKCQQYKFIYS